jgi:protein SCO1/2
MFEQDLARGLFVCLLFCATIACNVSRNTATATWLGHDRAPEISGLSVTTGKAFHLHDERGKIVIVSFGYTSCLELCPDTFLKVRTLLRDLGTAANQIVFAYVTVDPERDQPKPFAEFVESVDPRFQGIFLQGEELASLLSAYHVTVRKRLPDPARYARRHIDPAGFYAMDHTAAFWMIDSRGDLRVRYHHDAPDRELLAGVRLLLAEKS